MDRREAVDVGEPRYVSLVHDERENEAHIHSAQASPSLHMHGPSSHPTRQYHGMSKSYSLSSPPSIASTTLRISTRGYRVVPSPTCHPRRMASLSRY